MTTCSTVTNDPALPDLPLATRTDVAADPCTPVEGALANTIAMLGQSDMGGRSVIGGYRLTDASLFSKLFADNTESHVTPFRVRRDGEMSVAWAQSSRGTAVVKISDIPGSGQTPEGHYPIHAIHFNSTKSGHNRIIRVLKPADLAAPLPTIDSESPQVVDGGLGWSNEQASHHSGIINQGTPQAALDPDKEFFPGPSGGVTFTTGKLENRGINLHFQFCLHDPENPDSDDWFYARQGGFRASKSWMPYRMGQKVVYDCTSSLGFWVPSTVSSTAVFVGEVI